MDIQKVPFMTVFDIPVDEVQFAPFNPETRTTGQSLHDLLNSIRELGRVVEPIKLSRDGKLGDGHRRVSCARLIGLKTVPAIRFDVSVDDLFCLNGYARPVSNREWIMAAAGGIKNMPPKKQKRIDALRAVVGDEGIKQLAERGVSTHVLSMARMVANYCDNDDPAFLHLALWWMVNTNQQFIVRRALAGGVSPSVIEDAVLNNRRLIQSWAVS